MEIKVGDKFLNPENGSEFQVIHVSKHGTFINWAVRLKGSDYWSTVMNPVDMRDLEIALKERRVIFDTEAGRLFYAKN